MVVTEHAAPDFEDLTIQRCRCLRLAQFIECESEVAHTTERVGVLRAKRATAPLKRLTVEHQGFLMPSLTVEDTGQVILAVKGMMVMGSQSTLAGLEGLA